MARFLCLTIMLSSLLVADTALGAGWRKCRRPTTCQACPRPVYCCPLPSKTDSPSYCLQRVYQEYPGPYDLYECLTFPDGCGSLATSYEEYYFGPINSALAQTCVSTDKPCEVENFCRLLPWGCGVPGHGMTLSTRAQAAQVLAFGNPAAGPPSFYRIQIGTDFVYVAIVRIPPSGPVVTERFIGMEMEPHIEPISPATFGTPIPRNGAQFEIDYVDGNTGDSRKAKIWLKNDVSP
jgi:hypothetical protein